MNIYNSPFKRPKKIALEHPHKTGEHNQIHPRASKRLHVRAFRLFIQLRPEFARRYKLSRHLSFARVSKNAGIFHIAQYERNIRGDFAGNARVSDGHKVRAFARTQHADTEFALANHALYLQAGYVKPQALVKS